MYTDQQLSDMRFDFSRALEEVARQIDASYGDKQKLQDAYEELDRERSKMSSVVWQLSHDSIWSESFTLAYNAVDEAALYLSFATGGSDLDRPSNMATAKQHLLRAVEALAMPT